MANTVKKLYPNGKPKAFGVTFDDGVTQDIRFVGLLDQYGLKGTFNLNSQLMREEFAWTHQNGTVIRRLPPSAAQALYRGHEVASHSLTHPHLDKLPEAEIMQELLTDKENLQQLFEMPVRGFALPFHGYSERIRQCVKTCGFAYCRTSEESLSYAPIKDYYGWNGSIFHSFDMLKDFVEGFLETDKELALCLITGHSYDLDVYDRWEQIKSVFRLISRRSDVLPMTSIEIVDYLKAMEQAEISRSFIINHSSLPLWFQFNNKTVCIPPHNTMEIEGSTDDSRQQK